MSWKAQNAHRFLMLRSNTFLTFLWNDRLSFLFARCSHYRISPGSFTSSYFAFSWSWNHWLLFYYRLNFWDCGNSIERNHWFHLRIDESFTEILRFVRICWWKLVGHWTSRCWWRNFTCRIVLWEEVVYFDLVWWQRWLIRSFWHRASEFTWTLNVVCASSRLICVVFGCCVHCVNNLYSHHWESNIITWFHIFKSSTNKSFIILGLLTKMCMIYLYLLHFKSAFRRFW